MTNTIIITLFKEIYGVILDSHSFGKKGLIMDAIVPIHGKNAPIFRGQNTLQKFLRA